MSEDTPQVRPSSFSTSALFLLAGATIVVLTDAVAGTALALARLDMMGDTHASVDEFAKLDYGYTAMKLIAFVLTPWLAGRFNLYRCVMVAAATMTAACGLAAITDDLNLVFALRLLQGASGGVLLVAAQGLLFRVFPGKTQPLVQAIYAIGAVVAPATAAPFLQGWLLDISSWKWIFFASVPIGLGGIALLALFKDGETIDSPRVRFDLFGVLLSGVAAFTLTFVLNQGNRFDWLNDPTITQAALIGAIAMLLLVLRQFFRTGPRLLDFGVFANGGFSFGIVASLAAGFALLGSSFLIPSFAVSVLNMTPTAAGSLLLPSTIMFIGTLLLTAFLIQVLHVSGIVTVPFGILGLMLSMWMLSWSSPYSGIPDMMPGILMRGMALGLLFLSITLLTMGSLSRPLLLYGVGLFNVGRQMGGLIGIAFLQTFLEDQTATSRAAIAAHVIPGRSEVIAKVSGLSHLLTSHGMEAGLASKTAVVIIGKQVMLQANAIAFNTSFFAITLFFLGAAPSLIIWKIVLGRILARRARQAKATA